jgi:hypothetical protein
MTFATGVNIFVSFNSRHISGPKAYKTFPGSNLQSGAKASLFDNTKDCNLA